MPDSDALSRPTGSRERMLAAAIDLMRSAGLTGAGINEIVRASGAPKGSVYHFFPDGKLQIAAEALAVYTQLVVEFIEQALSSRNSPSDKVKALFDAFARRVEEGGFERSCAVGAVSVDLAGEACALQPVLANALEQWIDAIAKQLALGDARRSRALAGLVMTAVEGAYVRARAEASSRPFREAGALLAELAR